MRGGLRKRSAPWEGQKGEHWARGFSDWTPQEEQDWDTEEMGGGTRGEIRGGAKAGQEVALCSKLQQA